MMPTKMASKLVEALVAELRNAESPLSQALNARMFEAMALVAKDADCRKYLGELAEHAAQAREHDVKAEATKVWKDRQPHNRIQTPKKATPVRDVLAALKDGPTAVADEDDEVDA